MYLSVRSIAVKTAEVGLNATKLRRLSERTLRNRT